MIDEHTREKLEHRRHIKLRLPSEVTQAMVMTVCA